MIKFRPTTKKDKITWWLERRDFLEEHFPEVRFYIQVKDLPNPKKVEMVKKYDEYLERTKSSEAFEIYTAMKNGTGDDLKSMSLLAKMKLQDGDYEKPPYDYNPRLLSMNQMIQDYKAVCEMIEDFEGKSFENKVKSALV